MFCVESTWFKYWTILGRYLPIYDEFNTCTGSRCKFSSQMNSCCSGLYVGFTYLNRYFLRIQKSVFHSTNIARKHNVIKDCVSKKTFHFKYTFYSWQPYGRINILRVCIHLVFLKVKFHSNSNTMCWFISSIIALFYYNNSLRDHVIFFVKNKLIINFKTRIVVFIQWNGQTSADRWKKFGVTKKKSLNCV